MTFYLVGVPGETEQDIDMSIAFAKETSNFIAVDALSVYPGTPLYTKMKHLISFSLYPYHNKFTDVAHAAVAEKRKNKFFRSFYLTPGFLLRAPLRSIAHTAIKEAIPYVIKRTQKKRAV